MTQENGLKEQQGRTEGNVTCLVGKYELVNWVLFSHTYDN